MDCILKKSRWHEREKQKKESSIFHRAVKRHFSSSPETENWNCLLKKMRPVRPVNLSQPRLLPHIAPTGDPLHVRNTRRCETHVTHLSWNATQKGGGETIQSRKFNRRYEHFHIFDPNLWRQFVPKKQLTNLSIRRKTNHPFLPDLLLLISSSEDGNFQVRFESTLASFPRTFPLLFRSTRHAPSSSIFS